MGLLSLAKRWCLSRLLSSEVLLHRYVSLYLLLANIQDVDLRVCFWVPWRGRWAETYHVKNPKFERWSFRMFRWLARQPTVPSSVWHHWLPLLQLHLSIHGVQAHINLGWCRTPSIGCLPKQWLLYQEDYQYLTNCGHGNRNHTLSFQLSRMHWSLQECQKLERAPWGCKPVVHFEYCDNDLYHCLLLNQSQKHSLDLWAKGLASWQSQESDGDHESIRHQKSQWRYPPHGHHPCISDIPSVISFIED